MYINEIDKIKTIIERNAPMSMSQLISNILAQDEKSDKKKHMKQGEKYYKADHDILKRPKPDGLGANNKMVHQFHRILVDQKIAYIGAPTWTGASDTDKVKIDEYLTDEFAWFFKSMLKHSSNKGVEWLHPYWSPTGDFRYVRIPAGQCVPVYDQRFEHDLVAFIRYYYYDLIIADGTMTRRRKVEWWTKYDVTYYAENEKGEFVLDDDYIDNPAPHWETVNEIAGTIEGRNWGMIPFIPFRNNEDELTDLQGVKTLIDNYDNSTSDAVNNLDDIQELVRVIKGYSGEDPAELRQNLKDYKIILVDEEGGMDTDQADIPTDAREASLIRTKRDAFIFGQGVDLDPDRIGDASGVALQFMYSWLDLKANNMITEVIPSLKLFFDFVLRALESNGESISTKLGDIKFTFTKTMITNENEQIVTANASVGSVSEATRLAHDPRVDNVADEIKRMADEQPTLDLGE